MFVRPSFYDDFRCKAGDCNDSCCIGWEIDIDDCSLEKYNSVKGDFGLRLRNSIDSDGEYSFFRLCDGERCPFLNKDNLCDIYTRLGEDSLCSICAEHPRFYNQIGDITEVGLGLCCERVCELLFDDEYKLEFICDGENADLSVDEKRILQLRKSIFETVRSHDGGILSKMNAVLDFAASAENTDRNFRFSSDKMLSEKIIACFCKTEPINNAWTEYISDLDAYIDILSIDDRLINGDYEKLLIYLLYRHFSNALYDGEIYSWVLFCCISVYYCLLSDAYACSINGKCDKASRIENIKRWSKQIEYSTENIDIIRSEF